MLRRRLLASLAFCLSLMQAPPLRAQDEGNISSSPSECRRIYDLSLQHYKALGQFLPKTFKLSNQLATHQWLATPGDGCDRIETSSLFQKVVSLHSQKLGLLLPLSLWPAATQRAVVAQIRSVIADQGLNPDQILVIEDTGGNVQTMNQKLATMIFRQHVSILIGGMTLAEAHALSNWSTKLRVPSIILNRRVEQTKSRFVFQLGPDPKDLGRTLVDHAQSQGMKRLALMIPQNSRDGQLADAVMGSKKVEVVGPLVYNPHDFGSIDRIFKQLFHINDESRKQELLDLINEQKAKAEAEGVAFDSRGLMLPPQVDIDGLVIVDTFKNVRHLAKVLNFYGVKNLPLLGIPKWRAPELIESPDDNLNGAFFVDYLGSYRRLPYGVSAATIYDDSLVDGSAASRIDLQVLLSHSVAAGLAGINGKKVARHAIIARLEKANSTDEVFFGNTPFFRPNHQGNWPNFLFSLSGGRINPVQRAVVTNQKTKTL